MMISRRVTSIVGLCLTVVLHGCGLYGIGGGSETRLECDSQLGTDFEFNDTSGMFTVEGEGGSITFENGFSQTVGNFRLYRSGHFSWMVAAGETGTIAIDPPAVRVRLFLRDQTAVNGGVLTVLDGAGQAVDVLNATTRFVEIDISENSASGAGIATLTLANNGTSGFSVIDDFIACFGDDGGGADGSSTGPLADPIPQQIQLGDVTVALETVATGLVAPNWGVGAPGDPDRLFVVDQPGQVWALSLASGERALFLDVRDRLVELGVAGPETFDERGLLGLAFHPGYATNGLLYTYTSEPVSGAPDFSTMPAGSDPNHQSVVTEWRVLDPSVPDASVDMTSSRELLRIDQPQFNHNAGALNFGPDGYLYISLGDGGGADDGQPMIGHSPQGNGQDTTNLLGTVLRIDPLGSGAANGQYGIPADNPFAGAGSSAEAAEIFAYGLRNPFRFSFDMATGALYLADAGQNDIEEINIIQSGGNYGWNLKEGSFLFDPNGADDGFATTAGPAGAAELIDPIAEYDHDEGVAVIGGFVYRGSAVSALQGQYVFGDFTSPDGMGGRLFHLGNDGEIRELRLADRQELGVFVLGFGQDEFGEIYLLANETATPFGDTGVVLKIVPAD